MVVLRLAQRLTLAIFCADFLTMLAMNCFLLRPVATPWIFFPLLGLLLFASKSLFVEKQSLFARARIQQFILVAVAFGGICAATRWAYVVEPIHHQIAAAVGDDLWHIQELNSLVNSPEYPARSTFVPTNYLSFYYAPWMPAVALYFVLPLRSVTLTTALFAVNALYDLLLPLALLGMALPRARSHRQISWAIYLVALWSGVQSLYSIQQPFHDTSWPLRDLFGLNLQFSNLATLMIWVIHHLCSAIALLLAYSIWQSTMARMRIIFCALLLAFSVYSSAFVFLGATPFLILMSIREARTRFPSLILCIGSAVLFVAPLLWIYMRKPEGTGFELPLRHSQWMQLPQWLIFSKVDWHFGQVIGLILFVFLLAVQFFFVPWFLAQSWRFMTRNERLLCTISIAYLISTFFVGFTGANNYCMRGSIIPVLVLCWIASAYLPSPKIAVRILLILGSMGTWQTLEYQLIRSVALYFKPPPFLVDSGEVLAINQDRSRSSVNFKAIPGVRVYPGQLAYYVQKLPTEPWPLQLPADREIQTLGPAGPWSWQRRQ